MVQLIGIILAIVLIKLLIDQIMPALQKARSPQQGNFIDISEKWIKAEDMPYQKIDSILSKRERLVFKLFQDVLAQSHYSVYPHLRLADLLQVPADCQNRQEYLFRIKERSLDLVIFSADQLQPLLAVCFRPQTEGKHAHITDQFTDNALRSAGFKWMTVDPNSPPRREQILAELSGFGIIP